MRPHVELVHRDDLVWHEAELPVGEGRARQRHLSYDEETGAASTVVRFDSAWSRPGGWHHADTEWFVLSGRLALGGRELGAGGYLRAPAGLAVPALEAAEGTEILLYREYGDFGFDAAARDRWDFVPAGGNTASQEPGSLVVHDTAAMPWLENIYPDKTDGIRIKLLYRDPSPPGDHSKGWLTVYVFCPPGWVDHRLEHHPVFEEGYQLAGSMDYNYGKLDPGTYFFRPARIKHGHLRASNEHGFTQLIRCDGDLVNWNTTDDEVRWSGQALNYGPEHAPVLPGPVRSRSTGPWFEHVHSDLVHRHGVE